MKNKHLTFESSAGMDIIYAEFRKADVTVFATPLFFWSYSGLLKNVIDRLWALAERECSDLIGKGRNGSFYSYYECSTNSISGLIFSLSVKSTGVS